MNIVVINDHAQVVGGASKVALGSARALAERGHRVLLFTAVGPVSPSVQDVPNLEILCLDQPDALHHPSVVRGAAQGIWNSESARALASLLAGFSPRDTVVHLHSWVKALSSSVMRVASRGGFPTVLTLHDYFTTCPNGGFYLYPTQHLCHLRPMSAACIGTQCDSRSYSHKLWRVARQWVQEELGSIPGGLDCFLSISAKSEAILRPYLPPNKPMYRVPNPVDSLRDDPADPSASDRFTFVGRLSPEKGPALLASSAVAGGFNTTFVGDGMEKERLVSIAPNAEFTGWLNPHLVEATLRNSRALVFPSMWYETQGLTVAEAAAIGIPAIVSSETAAREWVDDGQTGLLFRHGDREDLQRKMRMLLEQPLLAKQMGHNAYERYWRDPYTMERHCMALERVYAQTLARRTEA